VILPVYVAERIAAREETGPARCTSIARSARRSSPGRAGGRRRFRRLSFDEVVKDFAVYGTPERVAERLEELRAAIGFTKLAVWMNVGSRVPQERVLASMRRFAELVAPRLR
jgi:alkanesulfonate monooxygenase SsuD/methylene tetrahydromethanopterin reductase-like flavin-dependent oxidoreductase (luciferase family)